MKRPNMVKCWNRKHQMKNEPERWDEFATRPIPVSYTHLDVYKRQG